MTSAAPTRKRSSASDEICRGASSRIAVIGAGVAGLTAAETFARAGCTVAIYEHAEAPGRGCSFYAGGMIAPWCEAEASEPALIALGEEGLRYWREIVPVASGKGTLLVAAPRDLPELARFGRRTSRFTTVDAAEIGALEPDLAGRFARGLFFAEEAHLDPRAAMDALVQRLRANGRVVFHVGVAADEPDADWIIDCRGHGSRDRLPDLRGVKGEMAVLFTREITLARPVQLLHPRNPVYIVPRGDGRFMVGATTVESEERGRVRARALLDLLGAAYAVHPAFGEAEVVEIGCDLRPAFPDNMPAVRREGRRIFINGLYRHGFLVAPALAALACRLALEHDAPAGLPHEGFHADPRERQVA